MIPFSSAVSSPRRKDRDLLPLPVMGAPLAHHSSLWALLSAPARCLQGCQLTGGHWEKMFSTAAQEVTLCWGHQEERLRWLVGGRDSVTV